MEFSTNKLNNQLVTEDQLKAWLGYSQRERLKRWLMQNGVRHRSGQNGRICVTLDDLNKKNNTTIVEFE